MLDDTALEVTRYVQVMNTPSSARAQGHVDLVPTQAVSGLALRMVRTLQTTLDINQLIALFGQDIGGVVPHAGVSYRNEPQELEVALGDLAEQSCDYRLMVEGEALGEIAFTRGEIFTDAEIGALEYLLCTLVYPLRNALRYKAALDEARRDPLTGVYNRGVMETVLEREIGLARRYQLPFSLLFMDIDRFKTINDTLGHATGDEVIRDFTACISGNIRTTDILARYGGDEFVVLLTNTPLEGAKLLAERIRVAIEGSPRLAAIGEKISVTTSVGVASLQDKETGEILLARADQALARAKQGGRNRIEA